MWSGSLDVGNTISLTAGRVYRLSILLFPLLHNKRDLKKWSVPSESSAQWPQLHSWLAYLWVTSGWTAAALEQCQLQWDSWVWSNFLCLVMIEDRYGAENQKQTCPDWISNPTLSQNYCTIVSFPLLCSESFLWLHQHHETWTPFGLESHWRYVFGSETNCKCWFWPRNVSVPIISSVPGHFTQTEGRRYSLWFPVSFIQDLFYIFKCIFFCLEPNLSNIIINYWSVLPRYIKSPFCTHF